MFDPTITVSVLLSVAVILSNLLASIINNCHQTKMKNLEIQKEHAEKTTYYVRDVFIRYFEYTGRCIQVADKDALKDYGEHYYSALLFAPEGIRDKMIEVNNLLYADRYDDAVIPLNELARRTRDMLSNM